MEFMDERSRYEQGALSHDLALPLAIAAIQLLALHEPVEDAAI